MAATPTTRCACGCAKSAHKQTNSHRTEKGACRACPCAQYEPEPACYRCARPASDCTCRLEDAPEEPAMAYAPESWQC